MKVIAAFVSTLAVASAFAPQPASRADTKLSESLMDKVFQMDLFNPVADQNDYGARDKMSKTKMGSIGNGSYVPAGLTADQYRKVRSSDKSRVDSNYKKNVSKAGKFQDFDQFYLKRGTSEGGKWLKDAGKGHTFAKTKYDYSGSKDDSKGWGDAIGSIFGKKK